MKRLVGIFFFTLAMAGSSHSQSSAPSADVKDKYSTEVLKELRLTRQVIQQIEKDFRQLQVAAIRIRVQQDAITSKESRLDSIRSEAAVTQDALDEVQDRVKRLEGMETADADDAERQRLRAEIADGKRERDRAQLKLDTLRNQDSQLTTELQAERARLAELIAALEANHAVRVSERTETEQKPSDPNGPRNKGERYEK